MRTLLAPHPMTPAEVADLVERTRRAMVAARSRGATKSVRIRRAVSAGRLAAEYAHDTPCSIPVAARRFGRDRRTVWEWWVRLYPDESPIDGRRTRY